MAKEITSLVSVKCKNGEYDDGMSPGTQQIDQAAQGGEAGLQTVGTTAENLDLGDVSTQGVCIITNTDSTNYVELGKDVSGTFHPIAKWKPGEDWAFRLATGFTPQVRANTAAVKIQYLVLED